MCALIGHSQTAQICNWDSNKKAAVVLTFDDWTPGQYPLVVPLLKKYSMTATFFPIVNNIQKSRYTWNAVKKLVAQGNEIGNHTQSHPDLTKISDKERIYEVDNAKKEFDKRLPEQTVVSFAYPYGAGAGYSPVDKIVIDCLRKSGHIGARSVWGISNYTYDFIKEDDDYYRIQIYGMNEQTTNAQFAEEITKIISGGGLLTFLYHSIDNAQHTYNDNWYALVSSDSLTAQLEILKNHEDSLWVTTFGNALKYKKEADNSSIIAISTNPNEDWVFELKNDLNKEIFNYPLTIQIKIDSKGFSSIEQNGKTIPIEKQTNSYIQCKLVPNNGRIYIKR